MTERAGEGLKAVLQELAAELNVDVVPLAEVLGSERQTRHFCQELRQKPDNSTVH